MMLLIAALAIPHMACLAQDPKRLAERHARISALYEAQDYAGTVKAIDLQLKEAPGTAFADSLHHYLYKYGRAHRKLKDAAAGVAAAERIYAMVKARGKAANELEALFDLSWTYYDVGGMKQCARVDSTAVVVADGDPAIPLSQRGRARQYLAFDYSVLGDHRNSAKWALAAIAQYEQADGIPPTQWAESYTAAGVANWHLGRIREAERYYMLALKQLGESTEEAIMVRKVSTYGNLGVLWQNAGDFARAKNNYHESLRCSDRVIAATTDQFTRDEAIVNRSRTYLNLATVYHQLGDHGKARELLDIAFRDRSKVLEADDPQLLVVQDRLADLELSAGNLAAAEALTRAYLSACEREFGVRSEEYIRAAAKLGDIAQRNGDPERADSLFALSIAAGRANADEATDAALVQTLQSRARMRVDAGRPAEAIADLEQSRGILLSIYDSLHYKVAECDVLLAEAALAANDPAASLRFSDAALRIIQDRAHALKASKVPKAFPGPHILPDAIYWNVMAKRMLEGTISAQWKDDVDLAITALARNKAAVEDEASKLLLIGAQNRLFTLATEMAYDAWSTTGTEEDLDRFLRLAEADRSTLLKSRLNAFAGIRFSDVPDSLIAREQELVAALEINADDRSTTTDLDKRERAYAEFLARLEHTHPHYFNLRYGEARVSLKDLREKLLTPERDLLLYAFTDEHLHMLVVRMDTAALVRVPSTGIAETALAFNASILERRQESYARLAAALYRQVFEPVESMLKEPELLIIPDGPLQTVNFEALLFEPTGRGKPGDHMLIQKHAIAYLLSATTAVQFKGLAASATDKVLAFAPGFSDEMKQRYLAQVPDSSLVDRDYLRYVRQPFATSTAERLGSTMGAQVSLGADASESRFRGEAKEYGILHLGTHAEMNATSPIYSRLVLSKDGAGIDPDADGYLHAYEIYELDLRAQLAVLTACETGTGTADAEGVRSLGYSFAYAGCPSLVMSLWGIDEKVSSEIITRFYERLAEGMPKHLALRQAKLDHLASADAEQSLPYYWAGLVLVGDVEPVPLRRPVWPWIIGAFAALALAAIALRRRKRAA